MTTRVGTLDVLGRAVYRRTNGSLYFNKDGSRVPIHGNMLWTASDGNVKMRGRNQLMLEESEESQSELNEAMSFQEQDQLNMAIAASLQDRNRGQDESERGMCVVCLVQSVDHMIRACNHACVCSTCAPQLSSCPICRELITSVERIWIA